MKSIFLSFALLFSIATFSQKAFDQIVYTGKVGDSKIVFYHADGFPGGSTATITTGKTTSLYSYCSEEELPKVQKLCWFSKKKGFDYKRNIKINLAAATTKPPKTITGTYFVNGAPVNFKLVRKN
jgi:hypothetical protein